MAITSPRKHKSAKSKGQMGKDGTPREYRCCVCPDRPLCKECPVHSKKKRSVGPQVTIKISLLSPELDTNASVGPQASAVHPFQENAMIDPHLLAISGAEADTHTLTKEVSPDDSGSQLDKDDDNDWAEDDDPNHNNVKTAANETNRTTDATNNSQESAGKSSSGGEVVKKDFGCVQGVWRGNQIFDDLKQLHPLRAPSENLAQVSKRFQHMMCEIIICAENLSVETGCWIYIAGQHATAVTPFLHYASPRLCAKAGPELQVLQNNCSHLMKVLMSAHRHEVMEVSMELEAKKQELDCSEQLAKAATQALQEQQRMIDKKDALINRIKSLIPIEA
ncbi:hypothetical protein NP233_g6510 [Leucocoprinus birnbaumii]|uniref:Uncharacterized protein n=1 Tax=Leucocoprinus birnbaumii TaxID=56174 RepID=A0AAD5VRY7_9AGAR|nr:hypothetical protein NP233_g6510 [Leucocoprinus birnbaumii]